MKKSRTNRGTDEAHRQISTPDGRLSFILTRTRTGVHVQRYEKVDEDSYAGNVSLQMLFTTESEFELFCQADETRFKHPLIYQALIREFHDLIHTKC